MPPFPPEDVTIVRDLARKCMALASSEEYEIRRRRWRDVNGLRKPDRAPVWCRPAGVWPELLPQESLECTDPTCRSVEYSFRQHLYKHEVGDDHIFEPWWGVGVAWDRDTEHTWGPLRTGHQVDSTDLGGFRYDPPIKQIEDYEKITVPTFTLNHQKSQDALSAMGDLLGEAMPVRQTCQPPLGPMFSVFLDQLRGMAPMLEDIAFRPELVHRAMAKLTEGVLGSMRAAEETGLLTPDHYGPMTCSDPINGVPADGKVRLHNLWGVANSQEFQNVSPRMHEEFLLNYQIPVFQQYGLVQYGCCEDFSQKIDIVLRIPNLRVFVCSAWTDLDKTIEKCGTGYTIMWRQSAADVTLPDDTERIRQHLDEGMGKLKGCHYQVVLREVQTLHGHTDRIKEWARLAIEAAEKHG